MSHRNSTPPKLNVEKCSYASFGGVVCLQRCCNAVRDSYLYLFDGLDIKAQPPAKGMGRFSSIQRLSSSELAAGGRIPWIDQSSKGVSSMWNSQSKPRSRTNGDKAASHCSIHHLRASAVGRVLAM